MGSGAIFNGLKEDLYGLAFIFGTRHVDDSVADTGTVLLSGFI